MPRVAARRAEEKKRVRKIVSRASYAKRVVNANGCRLGRIGASGVGEKVSREDAAPRGAVVRY